VSAYVKNVNRETVRVHVREASFMLKFQTTLVVHLLLVSRECMFKYSVTSQLKCFSLDLMMLMMCCVQRCAVSSPVSRHR
jgi:hypothetical protein